MGVRGTFYTLNGGPAVEGSSISIAPPATGTATYSLGFWSEDYSGNVEATNMKTFTVVLTSLRRQPPAMRSMVVHTSVVRHSA